MLCRRSASLISTTRTSSPMARKVLRSVSEARSGRRPEDGLGFRLGIREPFAPGFVFCVLIVARDARQIGEFGDAIDERRNHIAEIALDIVQA